MIFIISISSLDFPSKSFSVSIGGSAMGGGFLGLLLLLPAPLSPDLALSLDLDLDLFLSLSRDRDLFLRRSLLSSRSRRLLVSLILSLDLLREPRRLLAGDRDLLLLLGIVTNQSERFERKISRVSKSEGWHQANNKTQHENTLH